MTAILLWYGAILFLGIAFFPISNTFFSKWRDGGWLFSKTLGLFLSGWCLWILNSLHLVRFRQIGALIIPLILALPGYLLFYIKWKRKHSTSISKKLVLLEEVLFLGIYILFVYIIGFRPEAYGTEKFMDYGFLTAMARSDWMPFEDFWYAGESINYYYGGQYLTAFLMKLSSVTPGMAYNLMRASVTAFSFTLPFAFVRQAMEDRKPKDSGTSLMTGLLAGTAVAFCGNGHYIVYGIVRPILGLEDTYWFPNSTRYIGYNPDLPDKTIHEFPSYSTVLGDLHAHYLNLIFVITVMAIAYAWAQKAIQRSTETTAKTAAASLPGIIGECIRPEILLLGIMTGAFRWTNFWDFPIYFVVAGSILFFVNLKRYRGKPTAFLSVMTGSAVIMFAAGYLSALPFTLSFDQISSEIGLTHSHTLLYQLVILWGLPILVLLVFLLLLCRQWKAITLPDLTMLLLGLCAAGLVLLPELIYVKDIYGDEHYRANTMFKLTYQAFILFGIVMAYAIVRMLTEQRKRFRIPGIIFFMTLLLTGGYMIQSVYSWFGNIFLPQNRIHTDASVFVSEYFPSDLGAINYLNLNVHDTSVILEAPGDSYSDYGRVSVATGLPTVAGWYAHEWLWRGGHEEMDERIWNIQAIYTGTDSEYTRELIEAYQIRYIYIGTLEREKYGEIQEELLMEMGDLVYSDEYETYIIEISP